MATKTKTKFAGRAHRKTMREASKKSLHKLATALVNEAYRRGYKAGRNSTAR